VFSFSPRPDRTRPRTRTRTSTRTLAVGGSLGLALAVLLAACGSSAPPAPSANQGAIVNQKTPANLVLTNQQGQSATLAGLHGKVVVLAPFLSLCQDECPLITAAFIGLQRDLRAAGLSHKVVFVEATVDPGRDSVARLAAYQKEFGATWDLWTGSATNLASFWKAFGVTYQIVPEAQPPHLDWYTGQPLTYDVNHTDGYILIDAQGRERFVDINAPNVGNKIGKKLTALLNAGGLVHLHHPGPNYWTVDEALASISWLLGTNVPAAGS
jgi:cytochrome oxidase Cu insertion factor (SCO1/SenC/PrrC family)